MAAANCSQECIQTLPTAEGPPADKAINPGTEASIHVAPPNYLTPSESDMTAANLRPT